MAVANVIKVIGNQLSMWQLMAGRKLSANGNQWPANGNIGYGVSWRNASEMANVASACNQCLHNVQCSYSAWLNENSNTMAWRMT